MSQARFFCLLGALAAAHLALAMFIAPVDDELYYWCWSKELQPSYFDHPPLTAYLIRLSTSVLGDTLLGIRFFACASTLGLLLMLGKLTERRGVFWLVLTPLLALGSILMTPDAPLLFFWAAYAVWLVRMQDRDNRLRSDWPSWVLGGLLLGLGGLSKYTMALAVPGALLAFLLGNGRGWRTGFALHLLVSVVVVSPVLIFNSWHEFVPFRYQLAHASRNAEAALSLRRLVDYAGCQLVLIGAFPLLLLPWCLMRRRQLIEDGRLRVCVGLFFLPALFFLYKGASGRVEANWPLISYVTVMPLALHWLDGLRGATWKRWSFPAAFAAPGVVTAFLLVHALWHLPLPASIDRLSKNQSRFEAMHQVADWARAAGVHKIDSANYQLTSQLRFQQIDSNQLPGLSRPSHFTMTPVCWDGPNDIYFLWFVGPGAQPLPLPGHDFLPPRVLVSFPEWVNGTASGSYQVVVYAHSDPNVDRALTSVSTRQESVVRLR